MPEIWERQENETTKSFAAFLIYRELPLMGAPGEDTRSLETVYKRIGHANMSTVAAWSGKYHWVKRANAYDDWRRNTALAVKDVALVEYQRKVIERLTTNLAGYYDVIEKALYDFRTNPEFNNIDKILSLGRAIKLADDLARRAGGMPIDFIRERASEPQYDEMTYTVEDEA